MRRVRVPCAAALAALAALLAAHAAPAGQGRSGAPAPTRSIVLERVGEFNQPVAVAAPAGDRRRLFVTERRGLIRIVRDGRLLRRPFADLSRDIVRLRGPETVDQRGLFSIAFSPGYRSNGLLYAYYVDRRSHLRVDELRRDAHDPERVDPRGRRTVIDLGRVSLQHHGGQLQFGPDGLLWISTGQDDEPASSRELGSWHGKLLRIDPRRARDGRPYRVPSDNPFSSTPGAHPEVMAIGLRNPWRFAFDRRSGLLAIGDVGESRAEEVDVLPLGRIAGADFGWNLAEGRSQPRRGLDERYVAPAIAHAHSRSWCAIVGGVVVRDPSLPRLVGRYLYGDLCSGALWSARLRRTGRALDDHRLPLDVPYLVSFGTDGRGRVYAVSLAGPVWRLAPS